jgi:hypothetical protein
LTIHDADGVAVLTPLDDGVLVAAARRPGAAALLEILSTRAALRSPENPSAVRAGAVIVPRELRVADTVRVETTAASVDVLAPAEIAAEPVAELAGRFLAAIADGEDRELHALAVDLGPYRLLVRPIHPRARPPRFVAMVGGAELPGLLGRRGEQVVQKLREVS